MSEPGQTSDTATLAASVPPPPDPARAPATATPPSRRARSPLAEFGLDVLIALVVVFVLSIAASFVWGIVRGIQLGVAGYAPADIAEHIDKPGALFLLLTSALSLGGAALLLLQWRRRPSAQDRERSQAAVRRPSTWLLAVGTGLFTTLVVKGLSWLAGIGGIDFTPTNDAMIRELLTLSPWLLIPFVVLLAPLYEETLFRRVFYGRLAAAGRPGIGLVLSAALFALAHEIPGASDNTWPATLVLWSMYAVLGVVFALLYQRSRTLWAPIAAHATHNLVTCLLLLTGPA